MISLRHKVEREEYHEANRREEQGRHEGALLPLSSLERLIQDGARIPGRHAHEHVEQEHRHRQAAAVGRVHKPSKNEKKRKKRRGTNGVKKQPHDAQCGDLNLKFSTHIERSNLLFFVQRD